MKRAACVLLALCMILSLPAAPASAEGEPLSGRFGDAVTILDAACVPFLLDFHVVDCRELELTLSLKGYSGDPFDVWELCALAPGGSWNRIAELELRKIMADGRRQVYSFSFDERQVFDALALRKRDGGGTCSVDWGTVELRLIRGKLGAPVSGIPSYIDEDYLPIDGVWSEPVPIHNGVYPAYVLDRRLSYCMEMTMALTILDYTGYPFGDWHLYALDLKDNWNPIGEFRIEKEQADGELRTYDFSFFPPETFKALSICTREKGAIFTLDWDINFYAP